MKKNINSQGFTLIELSIVLIIGGLLVVGALQAYTVYAEKQKIERMNNLMANVDQAIQDFAQTEGRLPCPAPVNGSAAGNDYDLEQCSTANGVVRDGGVLIGKLPAAMLGIRNEYMRDIHSNYLVYAVTEAATVDGSAAGAVVVIEEGIDEDQTSPTYGTLVELDRHNNALYAITSLGQTGVGAYIHDGTQPIDCNGAQKEIENCDDDRTFTFSLYSERSDANEFYDDRVAFRNTIGGFANIPDVLIPAVLGETYTRNGSGVSILSDSFGHHSEVNNQHIGPNSYDSFVEYKKGDEILMSHANPTRVTDKDGNIVDLSDRTVDASENFIFANNPGESKGQLSSHTETYRYDGDMEATKTVKFFLYQKK